MNGPTAKITVTAEGRGVTPNSIIVFCNGKFVGTSDLKMGADERRVMTVLVPLARESNPIEVFASSNGGIWSEAAKLEVMRENAPKPHLLGLCIGINGADLTEARRDAENVANVLSLHRGTTYQSVSISTLLDHEASKQAIENAVSRLMREAKSEDSFVFYFAGHGMIEGEDPYKKAVFLPANAVVSGASKNVIDADDIQRWAKSISSQKQLWIFDACGSGTMSKLLHGFAGSWDFERIQFNVGVFILAGTRPADSEQVLESPQLGDGLLTYSIVKGLQGEAGINSKRQVTLDKLGKYVERTVPELYEEHARDHQRRTPAFLPPYGFDGSTFPLADLSTGTR